MKRTVNKSFAILLIVSLLFAVIALPCSAAKDPVKEATAGVVKIYIEATFSADGQIFAMFKGGGGSGAIVATDKDTTSSNLVLTAYHVIDDTFNVNDFFNPQSDPDYYEFYRHYNGSPYSDVPHLTVEYFVLLENDVKVGFTVDKNAQSVESDWALLHLDQKLNNVHALKLGKSSELAVNDDVWALGFPALVETSAQTYTKDDVIVTRGIISKLDASSTLTDGKFLMHNATITGGNSGGPLVDENGYIVGINTSGYDAGYYYATRIDDVRTVFDQFGIDYVAGEDGGIALWIIILIAAVVVILAAVIIIVVVSRGKKNNAAPAEPAGNILHLTIQSGRLAGGRYRLTDRIAIGRDPAQCNIVYPADTAGISGLHCEVFVQNGTVYLRDCRSSYGTFLGNGVQLAGGSTVMLSVGSTFYLADRENTFTVQY